jgi:hypothetical protein
MWKFYCLTAVFYCMFLSYLFSSKPTVYLQVSDEEVKMYKWLAWCDEVINEFGYNSCPWVYNLGVHFAWSRKRLLQPVFDLVVLGLCIFFYTWESVIDRHSKSSYVVLLSHSKMVEHVKAQGSKFDASVHSLSSRMASIRFHVTARGPAGRWLSLG